MKKIIYLPGLNGIRAIAAIAVLISHISLAIDKLGISFALFGFEENGKPKGYLLASHGVTMFFVLSGFLITYLLLLEKESHEINIKKFYFRRILRIWPLYYLYLILCLLTMIIFGMGINFHSLAFYIFFAANIPFIFQLTLPYLNIYGRLE